MLKKLTIQNYALIESLDIEFPQGLVVITGETGAGKSILLGAISLLLGGKFYNAALRQDKNCVVEGEFDLDGNEYILRRVISNGGRSRFFINDEPCKSSQFEALSEKLIDIHAQHKHLLLNDKDFQFNLLDSFSDNSSLLTKYSQLYSQIAVIQEQINMLNSQISSSKSEKELKEFQLSKLRDFSMTEEEFCEYEKLQLQLSNADTLKFHLTSAINLLESENNSVAQNIKESILQLQKCVDIFPQLKELNERLESAKIEIADVLGEVESINDSVESSPAKLAQIEEILANVYSLLKRFDCANVSELSQIKKRLENEVGDDVDLQGRLLELQNELQQKREELSSLADKLSEKRLKVAPQLSKIVEDEIKKLELPHAKFEIRIEKLSSLTHKGQDDVAFLFAANPKEPLLEIQKVASGGELSRLMLCIKKIMGEYYKMPTIFFDEIDVGVSGKIADKMGELLDQMGHSIQIFAITHLPQVASKGNAHLLIYKEIQSDGRAVSKAKFISDNDRVLEIARLLSGKKTTDQAIANAKVLLAK